MLAGTRTEPPVSVPRAKSARPQATAAAEPLEEPPAHPLRRPGVQGGAVEKILPLQAEGQFVADGLADAPGPGQEQLVDADGVDRGHRMGPGPVGVAAAGLEAGEVDHILDRKPQAIQRPGGVRLDLQDLHEGAGFSDAMGLAGGGHRDFLENGSAGVSPANLGGGHRPPSH